MDFYNKYLQEVFVVYIFFLYQVYIFNNNKFKKKINVLFLYNFIKYISLDLDNFYLEMKNKIMMIEDCIIFIGINIDLKFKYIEFF